MESLLQGLISTSETSFLQKRFYPRFPSVQNFHVRNYQIINSIIDGFELIERSFCYVPRWRSIFETFIKALKTFLSCVFNDTRSWMIAMAPFVLAEYPLNRIAVRCHRSHFDLWISRYEILRYLSNFLMHLKPDLHTPTLSADFWNAPSNLKQKTTSMQWLLRFWKICELVTDFGPIFAWFLLEILKIWSRLTKSACVNPTLGSVRWQWRSRLFLILNSRQLSWSVLKPKVLFLMVTGNSPLMLPETCPIELDQH